MSNLSLAMAHLLRSWRSLRGRELICALLMALYLGTESLGPMVDFAPVAQPWVPLAIATARLLFQALVFLLCWLPADRSESADLGARTRRLILAVGVGAGAAAISSNLLIPLLAPLVLPWLLDPAALLSACSACRAQNLLHKSWINVLGEALYVGLVGGLLVALAEMRARRRNKDLALQRLLGEQSRYAEAAMAARLRAKIAQVDPQQLFDSLLSIEQAYAQGQPQAPAQLDQLIARLRSAMSAGRQA
ncbi:hypothetical protein LNV09_07375 [Paucibacter sp. B2R-40]|uniref:hypothetical protein n=1 Tax=Paucibacter sp. B2R-40 TaxID=2893554 RepID=UPI0021E35F11|nr:hypothetical protein [Paucibacter sp. B2R-40]MCV2353986.1 hypothetical protein [Paucibacter sp. B2R-40]